MELDERKRWLGLMRNPQPERVAAVFFKLPIDLCVARVQQRRDHPTIPYGSTRTKGIVRGFMKRLVPPTTMEGFGQVFTVFNHHGFKELLSLFGLAAIQMLSDSASADDS